MLGLFGSFGCLLKNGFIPLQTSETQQTFFMDGYIPIQSRVGTSESDNYDADRATVPFGAQY